MDIVSTKSLELGFFLPRFALATHNILLIHLCVNNARRKTAHRALTERLGHASKIVEDFVAILIGENDHLAKSMRFHKHGNALANDLRVRLLAQLSGGEHVRKHVIITAMRCHVRCTRLMARRYHQGYWGYRCTRCNAKCERLFGWSFIFQLRWSF